MYENVYTLENTVHNLLCFAVYQPTEGNAKDADFDLWA